MVSKTLSSFEVPWVNGVNEENKRSNSSKDRMIVKIEYSVNDE